MQKGAFGKQKQNRSCFYFSLRSNRCKGSICCNISLSQTHTHTHTPFLSFWGKKKKGSSIGRLSFGAGDPSLAPPQSRAPEPPRSSPRPLRSPPLLSPRRSALTCVRSHGDGRGEVFPGLEVSSVLHRVVPGGSEAAGAVAMAPLGQEGRRRCELPAIHTGAALPRPEPPAGKGLRDGLAAGEDSPSPREREICRPQERGRKGLPSTRG